MKTKRKTRSQTRNGSRSRAAQKKGVDLLNQVIRLTGMPAKTIRHELKAILDRKGIDVKNLTLDELRLVVASYLREIMGSLLDRTHVRRSDTSH